MLLFMFSSIWSTLLLIMLTGLVTGSSLSLDFFSSMFPMVLVMASMAMVPEDAPPGVVGDTMECTDCGCCCPTGSKVGTGIGVGVAT